MEWGEIKEIVTELSKRNQEVCKHASFRRQFADDYLMACLRAIATDYIGSLPYRNGKNRDKFEIFLKNLTKNNGELRSDPPDGFEPGKTKNTEYAIQKWRAWLDSIQKKTFWEKIRWFFFKR